MKQEKVKLCVCSQVLHEGKLYSGLFEYTGTWGNHVIVGIVKELPNAGDYELRQAYRAEMKKRRAARVPS